MNYDYLPASGNGNGNGHSNGNGHRPPFRLAPIESPEEEARTEVLREIAPKIRRKVREDSRLSAGAKFFFYALFDDCFWHQVGGHGTGQIFADIRTLAQRFGHDEKSIIRWKEELSEAGWLWTNYEWPMTEWRLTPLNPAPAHSPHKKAVQMALGRSVKTVGEMPTTSAATGNTRQHGGTPVGNGKNGHRPSPSRPTPVGDTPDDRGRPDRDIVGETPTSDRQNAHDLPPELPRVTGNMPTSDRHDAHDQQSSRQTPQQRGARPLGRNEDREKTLGVRSSGAIGREPHPLVLALPDALREEVVEWAKSTDGAFSSRLEKQRTKFKQQRQGMRKSTTRDVLDAKIAVLDAKIDGPLPAYEPESPNQNPSAPAVSDDEFRQRGKKLASMMREATR